MENPYPAGKSVLGTDFLWVTFSSQVAGRISVETIGLEIFRAGTYDLVSIYEQINAGA